MYGCSVAATNAARQQGNMDTVFFNLVNGAEGESRIEMTAGDDLAGSSDEDTGYKVKWFIFDFAFFELLCHSKFSSSFT